MTSTRLRPLYIIPARGGSKGIPYKNIKQLGGRPLIAYSIDVALSLAGGNPERVILSTDDPKIASVAESLGLPVPYRRPASLATDTSGSREVIIDAMDYAYNTTRALPAFNEDGWLYYYERYKGGYSGGIGNKYLRYNILNEIDNSSNSYEGKGIQVDLNLKYDILPTWDVTGIASYSVSSTLQEKWWGDKTAYIASLKNGEYEDVPMPDEKGKCILPYGGIIQTTNSDTETLTARLQSNYRKLFGGDQQHLITATLGYEVNIARSKSMNNESRGYIKERGMQFTDMSSLELEDFPYYKEWLQKNHLSFNRG